MVIVRLICIPLETRRDCYFFLLLLVGEALLVVFGSFILINKRFYVILIWLPVLEPLGNEGLFATFFEKLRYNLYERDEENV